MKGRRSSLEHHAKREEILAALARRTPIKVIAAQYGGARARALSYVLYRWVNAHRPAVDRESWRAMRRLRKDSTIANAIPKEARIYAPDLPDRLHDLEVQKQRLLAAQNAAIKIGDLQRIAYIGDAIARNVRHAAALSELLRLREQSPASSFTTSEDYKALRTALLQSPAAEHAEAVLNNFEAKTAPVVADYEESRY